jgi:hypothetical protein
VIASICRRLGATAITTLLVGGCMPPSSGVTMLGVESSLTTEGRSHLKLTLRNVGEEDTEGSQCIRITWVKDATLELDMARLLRSGGEEIETTRSCHPMALEPEETMQLDLESKERMVPGTIAMVVLEWPERSDGTGVEVVVSAD